MNIYKVIFARNEIMSCKLCSPKIVIDGEHQYQQDKGQLIHALVKAESEADALGKANEIVAKFKQEKK